MLAAVMSLAGVVVGVALCVAALWLSERRRERAQGRRAAAGAKQAAYQRTLLTLDGLLTMRPDHPDVGLTVRALTADITELRLTAPSQIAELADMCVQAVLRSAGDPSYPMQLRSHFVDAVRDDLLGGPPTNAARFALPGVRREDAAGRARHAKPRRA